MRVVAFEGPPLSGKTTLIARILVGRPQIAFFDDYAVMLDKVDIPEFDPGSTAGQVKAFHRFMEAESARAQAVREVKPNLVVLDRSVDTLLAHARALDLLYGYDSYAAVLRELAFLDCLTPDVTFYLATPRAVLEERYPRREKDDKLRPYIGDAFLAAHREYYDLGLHRSRRVVTHTLPEYVDAIPQQILDVLN